MTNPFYANKDMSMLLAEHPVPCLSVYMPTHRRHPENRQDPIRFKNLVRALEESIVMRYSPKVASTLLKPYQALAGDGDFWNHTWDGLAVLGAADLFRAIKLQRPVPVISVTADTFHVKPLLRILQSVQRYQVLVLNRHEIRLFEGDRDTLDELELTDDVPRTIKEALGAELTEPHQTVGSYGGVRMGSSMRHAHGSKADETEIDDERFFRAVDRAVLEYHSRPSGLPLVVAGLTQHHKLFRQVSHNPFLVDTGVEADASSLTNEQLRERVWSVLEPTLQSRLKELLEYFEEARSRGRGSDELGAIASAAAESRVERLFIDAERQIGGRMDAVSGAITFLEMADPQVDDLLDDVAEIVLKKGGNVIVVAAESMPTITGMAATFRH